MLEQLKSHDNLVQISDNLEETRVAPLHRVVVVSASWTVLPTQAWESLLLSENVNN